VNAAFSVGMAALGTARRFLIAIFLTAADYGLFGLIFAAVTSVLWLMEIGIGDKFIQQDEADQEAAFQKAFTLNLLWTLLFCVLILAVVPLFAALYGQPRIILPGSLFAVGVLANAFRTPTWIFYREMRFVRERTLVAIEPVVGFVVTIGLGFAGASYWSLVIGAIAGMWATAIACVIACPYPIRFRYEGIALREYVSFSWPLIVSAASGMITIQLAVVVGESAAGLAGVGAIGLAGVIAAFADRVDQIVTTTLYPAVCAVKERMDLLFETFTKSNRLAMIWGVPFGLGLALFAPDLVHYVLGSKWEVATGLLQVFGVTAAVKQIGFNWTAFQRAIGKTRPIAVYGVAGMIVFLAVGVPGMLLWGVDGYALGISAMTVAQLAIRSVCLSRLFSGFDVAKHSVRALAPCLPAVAAVVAVRLVEPKTRSLPVVFAELVLYTVITCVATWVAERALLREMLGYLRRAPRVPQAV
jgi:lipopolysaccharide exporter